MQLPTSFPQTKGIELDAVDDMVGFIMAISDAQKPIQHLSYQIGNKLQFEDSNIRRYCFTLQRKMHQLYLFMTVILCIMVMLVN